MDIQLPESERRWLHAALVLGTLVLALVLVAQISVILVFFNDIILILLLAWLLAFILSPLVRLTLRAFPQLPRVAVVGVIYVLNGRIQSADMFGNPRIFDAARESLVRGYLADGAPDASKPSFTVDAGTCRKFLEEIVQDRDTRSKAKAGSIAFDMDAKNVRGVELSTPSMMKEQGGFLHGNYAPKKR